MLRGLAEVGILTLSVGSTVPWAGVPDWIKRVTTSALMSLLPDCSLADQPLSTTPSCLDGLLPLELWAQTNSSSSKLIFVLRVGTSHEK